MAAIRSLLAANHLPTADIADDTVRLFEVRQNNELIGTVGVEHYGHTGLLRSLAVEDSHKSKGIGQQLVAHVLCYCLSKQITELYLLTTTAPKYFEKLGFQQISRDSVSAEIKQTREFKDICPNSAVVMLKTF
nr:arsenic resistance N-acetyltransferase ArsN2 [uncultured Acetobacteroides sp.]